ncbi:ataxin-3-like isoform X2 [Porites lutea]|uniref:ataxin-3-like isoform X2 n=1 Tax=Porites lutea TaxID=51062 RepID=UPI003CC55924
MEAIFHEKQEGSLCAQHCLNALLQGPYFTAVDLADIARQLDEDERDRMAEGDVTSNDYQEFLKQPSSNMDDSGFFSIQVICNALRVWSIELIPFLSPDAGQARENPQNQRAFICNLQQHWLTIRKLGHQWFNLNSLLAKPELISETYLSLYLKQLQTEDQPVDTEEVRRKRELYFTRQGESQTGNNQTTIQTDAPSNHQGPISDLTEEEVLQMAVQLSLQEM